MLRSVRVRATAAAVVVAATSIALVGPARPTVLAAAPDVREITPAGIAIDGSRSDWDSPGADYLADMYEAANAAKPVLSKLYAR